MNERIDLFLDNQKVATICCTDDDHHPYCFSCFYALDAKNGLLLFKTNADTHHAKLLMNNDQVAGTIQPDKLNPLAIKGVQFTGTVLRPSDDQCKEGSGIYHRTYPFALAMPGDIWAVQLEVVKMTDNTLSFGKKIHWQRNAGETIAVSYL